MKRRRTPYQRKRRGEWHPAVERLRVPLIVAAVLASLPVALPVACIQLARTEQRRHQRAERTPCARCGAVLGKAALTRAGAEWSEYVEKLHREDPGTRFRLVRRVWAVCVACGQQYDYDEKADAFMARG